MFQKFYAVPNTTLGYGFAVYAIRKDDPVGARGDGHRIAGGSMTTIEKLTVILCLSIIVAVVGGVL